MEKDRDTPVLYDFARAVAHEAQYQRTLHAEADATKTPLEWMETLLLLVAKSRAYDDEGNTEKAMHHLITSAAVLASWHAQLVASLKNRAIRDSFTFGP